MAKKIPDWVAPAAGAGIAIGVVGAIAAYVLSQPKVEAAEQQYTPDDTKETPPVTPPTTPANYTKQTAWYKFFQIDMVTSPAGTTTATITDPSGQFVQSITAATKEGAYNQACNLIDAETVGKETVTDYRGYKIVSTYYAKRDPRLGTKYEWYYIAPDGTKSAVIASDSDGTATAKSMINQKLGAETETTYYRNYAINIDYNGNAAPPYSLRIYDNYGKQVAHSIPASSNKADMIAKAKTKVDSDIAYKEQVAYQNKPLDPTVTKSTPSTATKGQKAAWNTFNSTGQVNYRGYIVKKYVENGVTYIAVMQKLNPAAKWTWGKYPDLNNFKSAEDQFYAYIFTIDKKEGGPVAGFGRGYVGMRAQGNFMIR